MQAVVLSFDSLAANSLGCYGNDWTETPHWDRLAATGVVFDRHFCDTLGQKSGMAWSTGEHALALATPNRAAAESLGSRLRANGIATKLIVASEGQSWHPRAEFDNTLIVQGQNGPGAKPDDVPIAHLVKAGLSAWNDDRFQSHPRLLWLHAPDPGVPPEGFDSLYFEDFEERGQKISELSDAERAQHPAVYAGAVSLLDHWLGELMDGLDLIAQSKPTIVIVMAAKGYLWHRLRPSRAMESKVTNHSMSDQCIRTPLILKVVGDDRFKDFSGLRSNRLVQTCDLVPTLIDWFGIAPVGNHHPLSGQSWLREAVEDASERRLLWIGNDSGLDAIRSAHWLCVRDNTAASSSDETPSGSIARASLFAKPEDIWDVNDIAAQQPDVVRELLSHFPVDRPESPS